MKVKLDITNGDFKIYFTSDYHFFHSNVIIFDKRPFLFDETLGFPHYKDKDKSNLDIVSMNETLIENWNNVVGPNDVVFYLGDLSWRDMKSTKEITDRLNGKIYFIMGNHDDYKLINSLDRFEMIADYIELWVQYGKDKNDRIQICLMHYPILQWNRKQHGSYMIHGHSHGNLMEFNSELYNQKIMDVGCNLINYEPIDFWEVKKIMDSRGYYEKLKEIYEN